jgi:hypothetical protein
MCYFKRKSINLDKAPHRVVTILRTFLKKRIASHVVNKNPVLTAAPLLDSVPRKNQVCQKADVHSQVFLAKHVTNSCCGTELASFNTRNSDFYLMAMYHSGRFPRYA